jgi:hypothetical protein
MQTLPKNGDFFLFQHIYERTLGQKPSKILIRLARSAAGNNPLGAGGRVKKLKYYLTNGYKYNISNLE